MKLHVLLISMSLALFGCPADEDPWRAVELITDVAWSSDQTSIVYIQETYEENTEGTAPYFNTQTRNHRYSVYVAAPDGSDAQLRLDTQPTRPLGGLRYFSETDTLFIDDARENRRVTWVHRAGETGQRVAESTNLACDAELFRVLPSPDGATIAVVRGDQDPACLEITTFNATISLLDTTDLDEVTSQLTLGFQSLSPDVTWTPSGDFLMSDSATTYRITPLEWDLGPSPGCFQPATTSGAVGLDGRLILFEDGAFNARPTDSIWGCQCEAPGADIYCR